jgi:hypothetical protein
MAGRISFVAAAFSLFLLLTGCASRQQLSVSGPRLPRAPTAMNRSAGESAADRVKDGIPSLHRELKRGGSTTSRVLADLPPIPLISTSRTERLVGTAGIWTEIESTQHTPPSHNLSAETHTQHRESPGSRNTTWFLLVAGAVGIAAIRALSNQARKRRPRQE